MLDHVEWFYKCDGSIDTMRFSQQLIRIMIEKQDLLDIARQKMPFGKYEGRLIVDLPEEYLLWFNHKGWPEGKLGRWLQLALEVKINGLEKVVEPLKLPDASKSKQPKVQIRFDD